MPVADPVHLSLFAKDERQSRLNIAFQLVTAMPRA